MGMPEPKKDWRTVTNFEIMDAMERAVLGISLKGAEKKQFWARIYKLAKKYKA